MSIEQITRYVFTCDWRPCNSMPLILEPSNDPTAFADPYRWAISVVEGLGWHVSDPHRAPTVACVSHAAQDRQA